VKANTSTVSTENEAAEELRLLGEILSRKILPCAPLDGLQPTPIEGLELIRSDTPTTCVSSVYEPSLCLIAQGGKTVWLGDKEIVYGPLSCLVSSVHLPVLGQVTQASPDKPYLGVKLSVDPQEVTDLIIELGDDLSEPEEECPDISCGLCRTQAEKGMVEAVTRLVSLLDSQAHRISKVIAVLKDRFTEPLRIHELAEQANMSESSLFHSFKQVTRMSPLQFQKKLRLHEARRLMLSEGLEAATASFRVGYESPSHFSREYSRLFGAPPRADVIKLRGETPHAVRV